MEVFYITFENLLGSIYFYTLNNLIIGKNNTYFNNWAGRYGGFKKM